MRRNHPHKGRKETFEKKESSSTLISKHSLSRSGGGRCLFIVLTQKGGRWERIRASIPFWSGSAAVVPLRLAVVPLGGGSTAAVPLEMPPGPPESRSGRYRWR